MPDLKPHRTAIIRGDFSRPTRLALAYGVIDEDQEFFDYGCGKGEDVTGLNKKGFTASGWDPFHRPDNPLKEADIVNIGFVVNVIADPTERVQALRSAWKLTRKALVVSARLNNERRSLGASRSYRDGFITGNGTFQKFFSQSELRQWIDAILEVDSIAIAPGIFLVFREETDANSFLLEHRPKRIVTVKISHADRIYDENRELLNELMNFFSDRGRLPNVGEVPDLEMRIKDKARSYRRAWSVIEKVTPEMDWQGITDDRADDLLVDIALLKLNRRPNFKKLPQEIQYDIRAFFGSYKAIVAEADQLLFSAGNLDLISEEADHADIGKRLPTALYIHKSALGELAPVLRVYEGCARWLAGEIENTTLIKLATDKPKVSYLSYPNFDKDPHPALASSTYVKLSKLDVDYRDYSESENPPILHRKETFVLPSYPHNEKFERLTQQEERFSLYRDNTRTIGNRKGWEDRLEECGVALRGHRVISA